MIKSIALDLRHGKWNCGCQFWAGKPMFAIGREFYDWWWYHLHIGPFWISVDPY